MLSRKVGEGKQEEVKEIAWQSLLVISALSLFFGLFGGFGASFVLRDNDQCYYADENAISPLWKGQRFPMETCVSGWAMLHREAAVIEDIYQDPRVPADAYRPTFVKSMAMMPVRQAAPIAAIQAGEEWREEDAINDAAQWLQAFAAPLQTAGG